MTTIPAHRLQLDETAPRNYAAMLRFSQSVTLDTTLRHLIELRASQLNGCAFCLDMHHKEARAAGETEERLYMIAAWREARCYDERERAALALTEAVTLLPGGVPDDVWDAAAEQFGADELSQVLVAITVINGWNRLMVTSGAEPGHYVPGMFG